MRGKKRFKPRSNDFRNNFIDTRAEGDRTKISKRRGVVRLGDQRKKGGVERAKDLTRGSRFFDNSNQVITEGYKKMQKELYSLVIRPWTFVL